jgi:hypothetical protein
VPDQRSDTGADQPSYQDRRPDQSQHRAYRQPGLATMLGRLLYLVDYLYLAFLGLGDDGRIVGAHEVLAVEFPQYLQVCLGIVNVLVVADEDQYRVFAHCVLSFL